MRNPLIPTNKTYVIGDIHGRLDLLRMAYSKIHHHAQKNCTDHHGKKVICLGDYVDRGPDSKGVIDFLIDLEARWGWRCLKGNHEEMMVMACRHNALIDMWFSNGGKATCESYGAEFGSTSTESRYWYNKIDKAHVDWMADLDVLIQDEHRVYVHAGLMPGFGINEQDEETCLWIRDRFLTAHDEKWEKHVVHGHTPYHPNKKVEEPELLPHRTNLDTGATWSGVLTIGVFCPETPGGPIEVLTVNGPKRELRR